MDMACRGGGVGLFLQSRGESSTRGVIHADMRPFSGMTTLQSSSRMLCK